jgi:hypothetical protein
MEETYPGTMGGGLEALTYNTPGQHSTDPGTLPSMAPQLTQALMLPAALAALKVPAGQGMHASRETVPVTSE